MDPSKSRGVLVPNVIFYVAQESKLSLRNILLTTFLSSTPYLIVIIYIDTKSEDLGRYRNHESVSTSAGLKT